MATPTQAPPLATIAPQPPASLAGPDSAHPSPKSLPAARPATTTTPPIAKQYLSPRVELTGARALADNQLHQRELDAARHTSPMTSPNPARSPFLSTSLASQPVSRPADAPQPVSAQPRPPAADARPDAPKEPASAHGPSDRNGGPANGPASPSSAHAPAPPQIQTQLQSSQPQTSHANVFASPQRQTQEPTQMFPPRSSAETSRKRPLSAQSHDDSPGYSSYPPITPASEDPHGLNRTGSLPNSSSRAGGKSPATKKHRCPHCSTEFTRHHNLKSHLLTHSQEKPYGCSTCEARFRRLHDLKRHLKLHTGERPHSCEVCGRAFARGDALARHNKGPGGCAGRRESGIDEDDLDGDGDMDMDGDGPDTGDDAGNIPRRRSEPNKRTRRSSNRASLTGGQQPQAHGSTYPPVAPMGGAPQAYYHAATPSNNLGVPGARPRGMSPPQHAHPSIGGGSNVFSNVHYNQNPSLYAQGGVTESPKPLSPGQPGPHRKDARSPSISTRMQQQMLRSNTGPGTPPVGLPAPHQQLPSMQTTDSRYLPSGSARLPPPTISTHAPQPSGAHSTSSSGPASASTHPHSSGGSLRELYGPPSGSYPVHEPSQVETLEAYIRDLQDQNQEERQRTAREREENARLRDELGLIKAQIGAGRR